MIHVAIRISLLFLIFSAIDDSSASPDCCGNQECSINHLKTNDFRYEKRDIQMGGPADLEQEFKRSGKPLLVSILSPSCPICIQGIVQLVDNINPESMDIVLIWTPILENDSPNHQRPVFLNKGLKEYWDAEGEIASLAAESLHLSGKAWDVYLFYERNSTWDSGLFPKPAFWYHQLPATTGAPPDRKFNLFKINEDLLNLTRTQDNLVSELEFIYFEGCPNAGIAGDNLALALKEQGISKIFKKWNSNDPEAPPYVSKYGSPTILVNGADLFGAKPTDYPACRLYGSRGYPTKEEIAEKIAKLKPAG